MVVGNTVTFLCNTTSMTEDEIFWVKLSEGTADRLDESVTCGNLSMNLTTPFLSNEEIVANGTLLNFTSEFGGEGMYLCILKDFDCYSNVATLTGITPIYRGEPYS